MRLWKLTATSILLLGAVLSAQTIPPARINVLTAEERGAPDARDLTAIRAGLRNADEETVRIAVRALGRLQRPALASEILLQLKSKIPEVRSEAATAVAMALSAANVTTAARSSALNALAARLDVEIEAEVRGAICDAIGHIPDFDTSQFQLAERTLVKLAQSDFVDDRLGVARGLEALLRLNASIRSPAPATIDALKRLAAGTAARPPATDTLIGENAIVVSAVPEPMHDARVRRLAVDALIAVRALDVTSMATAFSDVDAQVRWRVVRYATGLAATGFTQTRALLEAARHDHSPLVREAAIDGLAARERASREACDQLLEAARDANALVVLTALNELAQCGAFPDVMDSLVTTATGFTGARSWQRPAAALVALAHASPVRADRLLTSSQPSVLPEMRTAVAKAAVVTGNNPVLRQLADDVDPVVAEAARIGLGRAPATISAPPRPRTAPSEVVPEDLRRLAAARARIVVRGVGSFEMALLTSVAPRAVLRFAHLAESGYFDGSSLAGVSSSRVNVVAADSTRALALAGFKPEPSSWPLVRGVVSFAAAGAGLDGSALFINLVDDPVCERSCTAFAHVLTGSDILDRLLDGDVIEKVEIRPAF